MNTGVPQQGLPAVGLDSVLNALRTGGAPQGNLAKPQSSVLSGLGGGLAEGQSQSPEMLALSSPQGIMLLQAMGLLPQRATV